MIRKTTLLLLIIISIASSVSAANRYVSDDLYTYVHAGPGTKYKIIGSVNAGAKIKLLKVNKVAGFSNIRDAKGRDGWINSKYVSRYPGLKERLAKLESKLANLNTKVGTANEKATSNSSLIRKLKNTNKALNEKLNEVQVLNNGLNEKLDTQKNDLLMRWFTYGGMVGGIGLFFGLILPSLIPNRKKRSRW